MARLAEKVRMLFDGKNFAVLSTLEPDGKPHSTVVWVKRDGDDILFALPKSRRKTANLNRNSRAAVVIFDAANPYESVQVQGTASVEDDPDGTPGRSHKALGPTRPRSPSTRRSHCHDSRSQSEPHHKIQRLDSESQTRAAGSDFSG